MKKFIFKQSGRRIVCCALLFSLLLSFFSGFSGLSISVFAQSGIPDEKTTFFVNIYNDENIEFFLENTEITAEKGITLLEVPGELKKQELIKDFMLSEDSVTSIELMDGTKIGTTPPPDAKEFYIKHNGETVSYANMKRVLSDGDIVELIYGAPVQTVVLPEEGEAGGSVKVSGRVAPIEWTAEYKQAVTDAADYLLLNHKSSVDYIVAMGSAGKSVDMKTVNTLLGRVRRSSVDPSYESKAKDILAVTFAGYDAGELVQELSLYEGPLDISVIDAVWMLIAYDCKKYEVSETSLNSRSNLIELLFSAQKDSGGFALTPSSPEDIFITSMAMTALSGYSSQIKVDTAIQKAVSYLAGNGLEQGENIPFIEASVSSRLLSGIIIGLTSANVSISDERFIYEDENLLDVLIKLQNPDGGFPAFGTVTSGFATSSGAASGFAASDLVTSDVEATEFALVALASVKNNEYPYSVDQRLTAIKKTTGEQLAMQVKSMSPLTLLFVGIAALTAFAAIIGSFVLKHLRKKVDEYAQELEEPK